MCDFHLFLPLADYTIPLTARKEQRSAAKVGAGLNHDLTRRFYGELEIN
jgi:hypothetical protein